MQVRIFFSVASLAQTLAQQKKKQKQLAASALIFKDPYAVFSSVPRASLLWRFLCSVLLHLHHLFGRVLARLFCSFTSNLQGEEDGVMGSGAGHTRRSKQLAKSSSTVLCDSVASLEDWKQQIKVKCSIPANQQRLTFTSQRLIKQPIVLANFSPSRQWQIVVDASIEELCKDLTYWRALFHSKNTSAELLYPLVLKESDDIASTLHSRTAEELRQIGVPCNVFFLSFNKWIPTLQPGIAKEHTSLNRQPRDLDLQIDEQFQEDTFLIDLFGDLSGLCLSMPLNFVMSGKELATKLLMVEQTAQYREKQKKRYHHLSAPALKDSESLDDTQNFTEGNWWSSCLKDYILHFEKNFEYTAFISRDHHRLRCIVLPVITIPLYAAKGNEEQALLQLLSCDPKNAIRESPSSVLALPSTSQTEGELSNPGISPSSEGSLLVLAEDLAGKYSKKKKRKKAKKCLKENVKNITALDSCAEADRKRALDEKIPLACEDVAKKVVQSEVLTVECIEHLDHKDLKEAFDGTEMIDGICLTNNGIQHELDNDLEHVNIGCPQATKNSSNLCWGEMDAQVGLNKQSTVSCDFSGTANLEQYSSLPSSEFSALHSGDCHAATFASSSTKEDSQERKENSACDHSGRVMEGFKGQEDACGSSKSCEVLKVDYASKCTEQTSSCSTNTTKADESANHTSVELSTDELELGNHYHQKEVNPGKPGLDTVGDSGSCSLSKNAELKKTKETCENKNRVGTQNILHREANTDYVMNSFKSQIDRREYAGSQMRPSRDGFWTHKASEVQDFSTHRNRVNQSSFNGIAPVVSRPSIPFWRHQRNDSHHMSYPTTFPRRDDWSVDRGRNPSSRQIRNMSAWEQLPDLRQPSNVGMNREFSQQWENHAEFEELCPPSARGQKFSNFNNVQRRNRGKSNEMLQQYPKKWLVEDMPNDTVPPSVDFYPVMPGIFDVCSLPPSNEGEMNRDGSTSTDQGRILGTGFRSKEKCAENLTRGSVAPCITVRSASATTVSPWQNNHIINYSKEACHTVNSCESVGFQASKLQGIAHVCNILEAVHASCQSRAVYEQVSSVTGNPLCEFEKVAKAVAPVFKASEKSLQHWKSMGCSCRSVVAGSCKSTNLQRVADVPLSTLWQWYEEPSCYGLEVKLTEHTRFTVSESVENQFQAFFVPYLSGMQLFGWSSKMRTTRQKDAETAQEVNSFDSSFLRQPIFSILLPKPKTDDDIYVNEHVRKSVGSSQYALGNESGLESGEFGSISDRLRHCGCEVELLYEFFEGEKPQQRRPLNERIKELVMGQVAPESCSVGDARLLDSVKIGELHPSSWFAVAWYPIYRIPDGTFRSAFLTYHSLSSLQSVCSGSTIARQFSDNCIDSVTSPVVGLMSYNAQAKDWFSLTPCYNLKGHESSSLDANPSEILQQHLATLEAAAASMARGSCDQSSSFKHLDYGFFQSRGR